MAEAEDELFEVSDRLVSPAEMADIMDVGEGDVLSWIAAGRLPGEFADDGTLRVRISEHHRERAGEEVVFYQTSDDPGFREEWARRRRHHARARDGGRADDRDV